MITIFLLFWLFGPIFTIFVLVIGLQLMYYLVLIAVPVAIVGLVVWLVVKLVRRRA